MKLRISLSYEDGTRRELVLSSPFGALGLFLKLKTEFWPILAADWTRLDEVNLRKEK